MALTDVRSFAVIAAQRLTAPWSWHTRRVTIAGVTAVCEELRADPLHNLSLNSKELFHSNLLAWLATEYPREVVTIFEGIVGAGDPGEGSVADRERAGLDLVLRLPGRRTAVIENKVWSLPDDYQLARYASGPLSKFDSQAATILLSLTAPHWDERQRVLGGRTWRHLGYDDLADRLAEVATRIRTGGSADDRFAGDLVERYTIFVRRLCRVAELAAIVRGTDSVALDSETQRALARARVHDGVAKLRAHQVVEAIRRRLFELEPTVEDVDPDDARAAGFERGAGWKFVRIGKRVVGLEAGFTNGNPLNSGQVAIGNGDRLIWQYQTGQWRLAIATQQHAGRTDALRQLRHDYIERTYQPWFDFSRVAAALGADRAECVPVRAKDPRFQRYDPDFAYRYCRVDDPTRLTLDELVELAVGYLRAAAAWPEKQGAP